VTLGGKGVPFSLILSPVNGESNFNNVLNIFNNALYNKK
jgi:hypothetical protein